MELKIILKGGRIVEEIKEIVSEKQQTAETASVEQPLPANEPEQTPQASELIAPEIVEPTDLPIAEQQPAAAVKNFYESKTLWVNIIVIIAIIIQSATGKDIVDPNIQAGILCVINVILRLVTKKEIVW